MLRLSIRMPPAPGWQLNQQSPEFMYADPEQQYGISPLSREFFVALLFSVLSHAVAITLVGPATTPTPVVAPLQVVLDSSPPMVIPSPPDIPEHVAATSDRRPEPVVKSAPSPQPVVEPETTPEPAPKRAIKKTTRVQQSRPKRPAPTPTIEPSPVPEQTNVVPATLPVTPSSPTAAVVTAESRKVEYLYNPPPDYPQRARRLGLEGEVLIRPRVLPNGKSDQLVLEPSSGYRLLDEAAMEAVRQWRFRPARRGDEQVISWVEIPVRFRLEH